MNDESVPSTVTEAIAVLRERGYAAEFELVDGTLRSDADCVVCAVDVAEVDHVYRFEGPSDPGDEMIVFAVRDPATGTRGTLAAAYGPAADPDRVEHLAGLRRRFE
jgi:hypothetical protein